MATSKPYTIIGLPASTCTQAVTVACQELGIPYKIVEVNMSAGEHKSAEYLETKQPFGQIPVLVEEDGFQLYESRAIARYLIAKHDTEGKLIPADPRKRGLFEQAISSENNNWYPYASGLAIEKVFKPMKGIKGSDEKANEYIEILEKKLDVYDKILGKTKYLAGDELTYADLCHLPYATLITEMPAVGYQGLKQRPNVARWYNDISSRESWKNVQKELSEWMQKQKK